MKSIKIDRRLNESIINQLVNQIQTSIINLDWISEKRMPNINELAAHLDVSVQEVSQAYDVLMNKGIVIKRVDGYYPLQLMIPTVYFNQTISIDDMFKMNNLALTRKVLDYQIIKTPSQLKDAGFDDHDEFVAIVRLYWSNGFPFVVMDSTLPLRYFPELKNQGTDIHYWDYFDQEYDSKPVKMKQTIKTIKAHEPYLEWLSIPNSGLMNQIILHFYDKQDRLIDYTIAYTPVNSLVFKIDFDLDE